MKKRIILVVLALVLLVCVSCSQGEPADTTETDNVTSENILTTDAPEPTEESIEESESEADTSEVTDYITQDTEEEYHKEPVGFVKHFRTYEDLLDFSSWGNITSEQWENDHKLGPHYDEAIAAFKKVSEVPIPVPKDVSVLTEETFGATYSEEPNCLDIIYIVDDVYYRFAYEYQKEEPFKYEIDPVLANVPIFNTTIDIYLFEGQDTYVTSTWIENVVVLISVYKKGGQIPSPEEISFDNFNFVNLSELSEK